MNFYQIAKGTATLAMWAAKRAAIVGVLSAINPPIAGKRR